MDATYSTLDGNEAVASVAYRLNEVIAIYPITPASPMGELSDEWASEGRPNLWGTVPQVIEMQSEAGAAGVVHGSLQAGALTTTFTASQGLLLMLPNLYKIAGELTPCALHVAARTIATHALSIFGDHSDVMACRQTGLALLASGSVQEAHDLAVVAHAATLRARVPFLHFFDGFRTSHEIARVQLVSDDDLRAMVPDALIDAHRRHALTPDRPVIRGTAQNPDTFFQAREAANPYYLACPGIVQEAMDALGARTGRRYRLFDYVGHPDAERVIVMMGSGAETAHETVDHLVQRGERVGVVKVRLYRPFDVDAFLAALPPSARAVAVLDRTKEPGAIGDPLYLDVVAALAEAEPARAPLRIVAGRYGLSSKEFTPAMVTAVLDELGRPAARRHFTVGIVDDVTGTSLAVPDDFSLEREDVTRAVLFGLGSDGTVGANKNTIKIIGEQTGLAAQGYFVYDSKKSGATTISHLRFGPGPIRSSYLVRQAQFVACHQFDLLDRMDVLSYAAPGATFLLNAQAPPAMVWEALPIEVQRSIIDKRLRLHVIDASRVAADVGLRGRTNSVLQTCFFALSGVLPTDEAVSLIKKAVAKSYGKGGEEVVERNYAAIDRALAELHEVPVPDRVSSQRERPPAVPRAAPDFVQRVTAALLAGHGDSLPVSAFPADGTWPTGTSQWEKRNLAAQIPVWDAHLCIQCNKCANICPHAAIRAAVYDPAHLAQAPAGFKSVDFKRNEYPGWKYTIQVAPEDCTGCSLCVQVCPAKDKSTPRHKAIDMMPQPPLRESERANYAFFLGLPEPDRTAVKHDVTGVQFLTPLFEYSGACAGCGETPYLKLLTQLFGDRTLIANATGCSSIYGGNLPTTPYTVNAEGRGPAWANSLFEDNAEFGLGLRVAVDTGARYARDLLTRLRDRLPAALVDELLAADQHDERGLAAQRARVTALTSALRVLPGADPARLASVAGHLVRKSVWIIGGDGWAYDIGYGGLDHVLSTDWNVNILVLDTEVYSNTGGQQSKATPRGAAAKFAVAGKPSAKKDLALEAMVAGRAYVARVAMGARDAQTIKAFAEADAYPGPAIIIAMSPCIAHGYDLAFGAEHQRLAVETGYWPLFRFDPRRLAHGEPPLLLDSPAPKGDVGTYMANESRFKLVERRDPQRYKSFVAAARRDTADRYRLYQYLAGFSAEKADRP